MSKKTAVVGEYTIELSEKGADVKCGSGGDTLNTPVHIACQVDPAALTAHYVTALGTDSPSQQMLDAWRGEDVDTLLTQRMENRLSSSYYTEASSAGERTFYYWRSEAAVKFWLESEQSAVICEELANFDYPYPSGVSLATLSPTSCEKLLSLLHECCTNGGEVIFDNNYHPRLWVSKEEIQQVYQQMLERTDIVFLALDDEDTLWGQQSVEDVTACIHNAGVKEVVVKHGADSYLVPTASEGLVDVLAVKPPKEKMVDTIAAGDPLSVGYPVVRLTGGTAEDAAKRGHLIASTVIQYRGAIIPRETMPT